MRLSMVFELLLIFLLVAFAAYARVIERKEPISLHSVLRAASDAIKQSHVGVSTISLKQATDNVNKYCICNDNICNCCRDFNIPVLQLKGPGCASVQYLKGDNMALQLSFGDNILTSTVVNGKSPKPVCVRLPAGFSKFCGRIYSIQREADNHFKACLGLELESSNQVEASLRVSCFRFGPDGLKLRPSEPLPVVESDSSSDDDDDDDDIFGLGADDDDDDDDDEDDDDDDEESDDSTSGNRVPSSSADDDDEDDDEDDDDDVLGLGSLLNIFEEDDTPPKKPKVTTPAPIPVSIPLLTKPISDVPAITESVVPVATPVDDVPIKTEVVSPPKPEEEEIPATNQDEDVTEKVVVAEEHPTESVAEEETVATTPEDLVPLGSVIQDNVLLPAASSVEEEFVLKPEEAVVKPTSIVNKINNPPVKKPTVTSGSLNAIQNDVKKPVSKPDPVKNEVELSEEEEDEDEDEEDILGVSDEDEDEKEETVEEEEEEEEETEAEENEDEDEDVEQTKPTNPKPAAAESDEESIVDDDDSEEELISELTNDDKEEVKDDKISNNEAEDPEEDDADYGFGLAEMLARKRNQRRMRAGGRQSRVMRL